MMIRGMNECTDEGCECVFVLFLFVDKNIMKLV